MAADHQDSRAEGASADAGSTGSSRRADLIPGSLASLDSTLPPTPLKDLLAADGASIYVLSADAELLQAVQQAGGEQYPIYPVPGWRELTKAVDEGRTRIVLLDNDAVAGSLADALAELEAMAPLVVIVAAKRDDAQSLMGLLSDRKIHRLLIKPAAHGITRLLLESAVSRYLQLRDTMAPRRPALPLEEAPRRSARGARTIWPVWLLATALASLLLGAVVVGELAGWRLPNLGGRAGTVGAPETTSAAALRGALPEGEIGDRGAVEVGRADQVGPGGGSSGAVAGAATDGTGTARTAASTEAGTSAAETGAAETAAATGVGASRTAGDGTTAAAGGATEGSAGPTEAAPTGTVETRVAAAAPAVEAAATANASSADATARVETGALDDVSDAAPAAQPGVAATRSPELQSLLTLASARLARGQLLLPEGDSARAYLERAAAMSPNDSLVLELQEDLAGAVVASARLALGRGDLEAAQAQAEQASRLGADRDALAVLDAELQAALRNRSVARQAELLASARSALADGRLIAPPEDSARGYLDALAEQNAALPGLEDVRQRFRDAVASRARGAIEAGEWTEADEWIAALGEVDAALAETIGAERLQAEFLATPAPAGTLRLLESPPAVYPPQALRTELEGWVDVDFVVDTEGRARDITVVESTPGERFNEAAIEMIAGQRYEPFELDGRRYERRLRVRVRFTLD